MIKHEEFQILINEMRQQEQAKLTDIRPILESDQILDFWCRKDGEDYYLFIAHPKARKLRYPLEYGYSEKVGEVRVNARFYGEDGERPLVLDFAEKEVLLTLKPQLEACELV